MRSDERELKDVPQTEARAGYITPTPKPSSGGMSAAMLAVTIACAIGAGALLTTGGQGGLGLTSLSGGFDSIMRATGLSAPAQPAAEQTASLAAIQRDIGHVATNVDALATRMDIAAQATDLDMSRLKAEVGSLKTVLGQPVAHSPSPSTDAALASIRDDIAALKGGLAQNDTVHAADIAALAKRLERLELAAAVGPTAAAATSDVTGSIPDKPEVAAPARPLAAPLVRHSGKRPENLGVPGWTASEIGNNIVIKGPTGVYVAETRTFVPGLGRIVGLRDHGRLVVVGDKLRSLFDFDATRIPARS